MDYTKTVIEPIKQAVPRSRVRAWVEDYSSVTAEVLFLEGEVHLGRKPVRPSPTDSSFDIHLQPS